MSSRLMPLAHGDVEHSALMATGFRSSGPSHGYHIAAKELVPVVMAIALWKGPWLSTIVLVYAAVVVVLTSGSARNSILMHHFSGS